MFVDTTNYNIISFQTFLRSHQLSWDHLTVEHFTQLHVFNFFIRFKDLNINNLRSIFL